MAVVLNIGHEISIMQIKKNTIVEYSELGPCDLELLEGPEFKDYLLNLVNSWPALSSEPVYVTLSSGCGIVYKIFSMAADSVLINGTRTTVADMRAEAKEIFLSHLPYGLEGEYIPSVMTEYKNDTDYIMSCAYIPKNLIDNIISCFEEAKISLFDVHPLVYGVYKALNVQSFSQVIIDLGDDVMLVNGLGMIGWSKPDTYSEDMTKNYLITQSQVYYNIDPAIAETFMVDMYDIETYMLPGLVSRMTVNPYIVAAFGLLHTSVKLNKESMVKKGGLQDVVAKLRVFLNGKSEE